MEHNRPVDCTHHDESMGFPRHDLEVHADHDMDSAAPPPEHVRARPMDFLRWCPPSVCGATPSDLPQGRNRLQLSVTLGGRE